VRKILKALNEVVGIRGSIVVSHDGMVVASSLGKHLDEDRVAAMASSVVHGTHVSLKRQGLPAFKRLTLATSQGKMVFTDTGVTYLVAVMDAKIDLGPASLEVESAARKIRSLGEMKIG